MQTISPPAGTLHKLAIDNTPENRATLSFYLKQRRKELDIGQSAVATKIGVKQTAISSWENMISFPSGENQRKLFEWLGWSERTIISRFGILEEEEDVGINTLSSYAEKLDNPDLFLLYQRIGGLLCRRFQWSLEREELTSDKGKLQKTTNVGGTIIQIKGAEAHMNKKTSEGYDYPLNFKQRQKLQKLLVASSTLLGWSARSFAESTGVPLQLIEEAIELEIPSDIEYSYSVIAALSSHCCRLISWKNNFPEVTHERYGDDIEGFLRAIKNSDSLVC